MTKTLSAQAKAEAVADLRAFVRISEAAGDLVRVSGADPSGEMGALYELSMAHLYPPVLLFEKIKGADPSCRVITSLRTSRFMVGDLDLDSVRDFRQRRRKGDSVTPLPPQTVNSGPIFENTISGDAVDIYKFPAVQWHEEDGGPYLGTECLVIVKDPESDWVNVGTYRTQMQDKNTITVYMEPGKHGDVIRRKYWAQGKPCPMVVCFGQAPMLGSVARVALPAGVSEFDVAGGRMGQPVKVVKGPLTGLPIPAEAEVAFECDMVPPEVETREEGPFGEWPGYYASGRSGQPATRVRAIYHRNDPIIIGQPPVKPTLPGRQANIPGAAAIWDALEAAGVPGIQGVWKMPAGGNRYINVVAIKQLHPGHAKMAGLVATGCGAAAFMGRMTIIVDEDIDITDPAEVMWAMATRWDPKSQSDVIDGCWSGYLDPILSPAQRETGDMTNSRIIIYAVRPYHWKDQFPKVNTVSRAYADEIRAKWRDRLPFLQTKLAD